MRTRGPLTWVAVGALAILFVLPSIGTSAVVLPDPIPGYNSLWSGNVLVYSMPFLNNLAGYSAKPSAQDPFYVASDPGELGKDQYVVVGTGTNNNNTVTNPDFIENAYGTPNKTGAGSELPTSFSTVPKPPDSVGPDNPPPTPHIEPVVSEIINGGASVPDAYYWDASTTALRTTLFTSQQLNDPASKLVFWFNQNETGGGIKNDLYVWMEFLLVDEDTGNYLRFVLSALDDPLTVDDPNTPQVENDELAAGLLASGTVAGTNAPDSQTIISDPRWSHVHGQITLNKDGTFLHFGGLLSGDPAGAYAIEQNLGANNATFAGFIEAISDQVKNINSVYDTLRIKWVMNDLNDGYEQLFLSATTIQGPTIIPEPASLGIWTFLGLTAGIGAWRARRRRSA